MVNSLFLLKRSFGRSIIAWTAMIGLMTTLTAFAQQDSTATSGNDSELGATTFSATDDASARRAAVGARIQKLEEAMSRENERMARAKAQAAGQPSVTVGGRLQYDIAYFDQSPANTAACGHMIDGVGPRSIRIGAAGKANDVVFYRLEMDFTGAVFENVPGPNPNLLGNGMAFRDVMLGVTDLPMVGNLWLGHFKEPYSLEETSSDLYRMFLETPMVDFAWTPSRNLGAMFLNTDESRRFFWQIGAFQNDLAETLPQRHADNLATAVTGRLAWLALYDENVPDRGLLHLGVSYSYREGFGDAHHFRSRPSTGFGGAAAFIINAGNPNLADYQLYGAELAAAYGPMLFKSEFKAATLNPKAGGNPEATLRQCHAQVGYFLTGENRVYDRERGLFGRVTNPNQQFFRVRDEDGRIQTGSGAWELAYRIEYLDATQGYWISRDLAVAHTIGVSWYLNANTRLAFNLVHADTHRNGQDTGCVDVPMMRAQISF